MRLIATALFLLATLSSANAQQFGTNEKSARVWAGSTGSVVTFKNQSGEAIVSGGWLDTGLSYQLTDNFFGELSYSKNRVDSVEVDGETTSRDDTWSSKGIGIGFRLARTEYIGNYFGAAYYHDISGDDSEDSSSLISLFMEKDNYSRFGRLSISKLTKDATGTSVGGTHVWFLQSGLGLGFEWSYETGKNADMFDTELKYTGTTAGLLVMFRL
ncbi:hypothetical protein N9850_03135 [Granulosicoccus sp.]|nr:hypothetical protein [Granulosicoccus sp.]MDB4222742.1 hypothetical protein [Granulosicoccus sp.]